jgi:hypothetical protein
MAGEIVSSGGCERFELADNFEHRRAWNAQLFTDCPPRHALQPAFGNVVVLRVGRRWSAQSDPFLPRCGESRVHAFTDDFALELSHRAQNMKLQRYL